MLLESQSFNQIKITDITKRSRIGYATFFRHYATKEDLLNDLAGDEIRDLFSLSIPVLHRVNSLESCRTLCAYVDRRRPLWRALLTGGARSTMQSEFVRQAREWVPKNARSIGSVPLDFATVYAAAGTIEALSWWLETTENHSVNAMAAILNKLIAVPLVSSV